jgi:hypothetical protein
VVHDGGGQGRQGRSLQWGLSWGKNIVVGTGWWSENQVVGMKISEAMWLNDDNKVWAEMG